jgi:hypothetical protein
VFVFSEQWLRVKTENPAEGSAGFGRAFVSGAAVRGLTVALRSTWDTSYHISSLVKSKKNPTEIAPDGVTMFIKTGEPLRTKLESNRTNRAKLKI